MKRGIGTHRLLLLVALGTLAGSSISHAAIVIDRGKRLFNYTAEINPTTIASLLATSYNAQGTNHFDAGQFRSTKADSLHGLGWVDDTISCQIGVGYTIYGDADLNGTVELPDLGRILTNWATGNRWSDGDSDYNGKVDLADLGIVLADWNCSVGTLCVIRDTSAVPEPAGIVTWLLLSSGLALLIGRQRCRGERQS